MGFTVFGGKIIITSLNMKDFRPSAPVSGTLSPSLGVKSVPSGDAHLDLHVFYAHIAHAQHWWKCDCSRFKSN